MLLLQKFTAALIRVLPAATVSCCPVLGCRRVSSRMQRHLNRKHPDYQPHP